MTTIHLRNGDCVEVMRGLAEGSVGAVVSDPPYGLRFMGKAFDDLGDGAAQREWHRDWLMEAYQVLKPGGVIKAFGGTRTFHHLGAVMREAGFTDLRVEAWSYGSGFPKSLNVGKAIDKAAGAEREVVGTAKGMGKRNPEWNGTAQGRAENSFKPEYALAAPATDAARTWDGWGTALKPAWEPVLVGTKP
jgi:hypothetical protein